MDDFWDKFGRLKSEKYKSHNTLISMDIKRHYYRLIQCKTPHEKRRIRTEMASFSIGSKIGSFGKIAKGIMRKFLKMDEFFGKLRKAEKCEIPVAQYPN